MKKHFQIGKLFTAFVAGLLVMAFAGSSLAAVTSVIPNFTSLKVGTPATDPATGGISTSGTIKTSGLFIGAGLKVSSIVPTASTVTVTGDLDVTGDLTGDSIGYVYTALQCYGDETVVTAGELWQTEISCATGDYLLSCSGSAQGDEWYRNYTTGTTTCTTLGNADSLYAQAVCFSADGAPSTVPGDTSCGTVLGSIGGSDLASVAASAFTPIEDTVQSAVSEYFSSPEFSIEVQSMVDTDMIAELVGAQVQAEMETFVGTIIDEAGLVSSTDLATALAPYVTSSSLTSTLSPYAKTSTLASYVTSTSLATSLASYVTSSSLTSTLSSYATTSAVSAIQTTVNSLNSWATSTFRTSYSSFR